MAKRDQQQLLADIAVPAAIRELNSRIDAHLEALVTKYPKNERDTWPTSVVEAKKVLSDSSAPSTHIDAACLECGLDKVTLATIILSNADDFEAESGRLVGIRIKYKQMIKAATSADQIQGIVEEFKEII